MKTLTKIDNFLNKSGHWLIFLAAVSYILIFVIICFWKYLNFQYNALDLAIINQATYLSSQGKFFASSIHPPTYLGDHFTPILFLFLPFYFIFRHPLTLLIIQTIILATCSWPIYLIAKNILNKKWAVFFALAWLINPFVQNINLFEFHFLPTAIFFILWTFYFYQKNKFLPFLLFSALALIVREDVAFVIFMFGLIALLERKKMRFWLAPILLSGLYFLLTLKIINFFNPDQSYKFFIYYSWLGETPILAIKNLFFQPQKIIIHLLKFGNFEFILGLLLPFIFLPLINPFYLLLGLGVFSQLVLGASGTSGTLLEIHYSSLLLPAIFLAAIYSIKKIIQTKSNLKQKIIYKIKENQNLAFTILVISLIYSTLTLGPIVGSLAKIWQNGWQSQESQNKKELIQKIPKEAAVAASYEFLTPLSLRTNLYSLNYVFLGKQQFLTKDYSLPADTQYLLINFNDLITYQLQYGSNPFYQNQYQQAQKKWPQILKNFGLIEIKDSIALYQKDALNQFNLIEILNQMLEIKEIRNIDLDGKIKFIGFNRLNNSYQLFWQTDNWKNYRFKLSLVNDKNEIVSQKIYPLAYDLISPEQNLTGLVIQTNYWFSFNKKIPPGNFELKLNLIDIISGGVEVDSNRATKNVIDQITPIGQDISLGQITL